MAGSLEFIKSATGSGVSNLSVTDCFSDKYDVYYIDVVTFVPTSNATGQIRLIDSGGSFINDLEYDYAHLYLKSFTSFVEERVTGTSFMGYTYRADASDDKGVGLSLYIFNPNDSSSYTFGLWQTTAWDSGSGLVGRKGIGVHKSAEQISGVSFSRTAGTQDVAVSVYGVK